MFRIVLVEPEIPPNTGNVIRLSANTSTELVLVEPLGFELDDARLRRAGLDYHEWARLRVCASLEEALSDRPAERCFALSTKGRSSLYGQALHPGDTFVFGPETRGLSTAQLARFAPNQVLRLPMTAHSRSLNLSNAVAVTIYEAWRQNLFGSAT